MICLECGGKGTAIYWTTVHGDATSMTMKKFEDICHTCHGSGRKPQTNADRRRAMSDEEMAGEMSCPLTKQEAAKQLVKIWAEAVRLGFYDDQEGTAAEVVAIAVGSLLRDGEDE